MPPDARVMRLHAAIAERSRRGAGARSRNPTARTAAWTASSRAVLLCVSFTSRRFPLVSLSTVERARDAVSKSRDSGATARFSSSAHLRNERISSLDCDHIRARVVSRTPGPTASRNSVNRNRSQSTTPGRPQALVTRFHRKAGSGSVGPLRLREGHQRRASGRFRLEPGRAFPDCRDLESPA